MRELTLMELDLIAGGSGSEAGDDNEDIVVTGSPYPPGGGWPSWPPPFPSNPPVSSPGGGGGGGGSSNPVADHTQDCSTGSGAAVQIAKHVMGTVAGSGPPNPLTTANGNTYENVEFTAIVVRNSDGTYGALNDKIYSNDAQTFAYNPDVTGTSAVGIWHNHPDRGGSSQDNIDKYPSVNVNSDGTITGDWAALAKLKATVAPNDASFDPSIFITGPDGVTREFKLSERASFESLTQEQMAANTGLNGHDRTQSCA